MTRGITDRALKAAGHLPAAGLAGGLRNALNESGCVLVSAEPGAGKSTLLPLLMLDCLPGRILMLEPRRIAARQIACRMAAILGEEVGETVGYRVRFENRVSSATRLEVLTEGILGRMICEDPTLEGVSALIFDEFHERSLNCDCALAMARESAELLRPDLKIVLMSATMDTESISRELGAVHLSCGGRMFPVETEWDGDCPENIAELCARLPELMARRISRVFREHEGDLLAFFPGEGEIRRCAALMEGKMGDDTDICPLYGQMSLKEQRLAIEASGPGRRKIVLATPIAETSLTIEGVGCVVDSGLYRKNIFNPRSGLDSLECFRVSRDMADQRRGRAGRTGPGYCLRLWSRSLEQRLPENRVPEILEAELSSVALQCACWDGSGMASLPWLTPPPPQSLAGAAKLLEELGATENGRITPRGRLMAAFPCHPRIAGMLLTAGKDRDSREMACRIAALLGEKDPLPGAGCDLALRLDATKSNPRISLAVKQFRNMLEAADRTGCNKGASDGRGPVSEALLLAAAYPERVARQIERSYGQYMTAGGEIAAMDGNDALCAHEYIVIADFNPRLGGVGRIFLALAAEKDELRTLARSRECLSWDSREGCVKAAVEERIGRLCLSSRPAERPQDCSHIICEAAAKEGRSMLDFGPDVEQLQRRVATAAQWRPELELPDLSTEAVLARVEEWLPPYLNGVYNIQSLKKIDLCEALLGLLGWEQRDALDRIAPSSIALPSGRRVKLEYRQGAELPVLKLRLQECFGMRQSPAVDEGRRRVLMELLSPGFKPVQLTSDLESFWQNTYFEVRKELRRRYPKHSWPENPLEKI